MKRKDLCCVSGHAEKFGGVTCNRGDWDLKLQRAERQQRCPGSVLKVGPVIVGLEGLALLWRGAGLSRLPPAVYPTIKSRRTNNLGAEVICHFDPFFCPFSLLGLGGSSPYTSVSPAASSSKAVEVGHQGSYNCITGPCWGKPLLASRATPFASI